MNLGRLRHFQALSECAADAVDFKDCVTLAEALAGLGGS
jgi:hypothetical protein